MDDSDDSLEVVYAGMDAGELEEVSSCGNLSGSDDNNESGRGNESVIDPSLPGPSSGSVGVSRRSSRLYRAENETDSSEESARSEDSLSDDDESEREESSPRGKAPKRAKTSQKSAETEWRNANGFSPLPLKNFDNSNSGIQAPFKLPTDAKEMDYFKLFFDHELVGEICKETNSYANQLLASSTAKTKTLQNWVRTTHDEMYRFLGLVILMGIVVKKSYTEYWSTNPIIHTPIFSAIFTRKRFLQIKRCLHFSSDTGGASADRQTDRLRKIRPVVSFLTKRFSEVFMPLRNLCIDESLLLWKGRLLFKQYIPKKRNRFGIKLFVLCDCKTRYILDFIVYTGDRSDITFEKEFGYTGSVVRTLLSPYLGKGHILYVDNWYSSPTLFANLFKNHTGACGTVGGRRTKMPCFRKILRKGQIEAYRNDALLAMKWKAKRDVRMLTTVHKPDIIDTEKTHHATGEIIRKPACVVDYSKHMGGVDKTDMQISLTECTRKTRKWYIKLFFHLVDMSLYNAYALYKVNTGKKLQFVEFRKHIVEQIFEHHSTQLERTASPSAVDNPNRLVGRHFPSPVPETPGQGRTTQRRCHVCRTTTQRATKRKETWFMCTDCNVALCVHPCFKDYHTLRDY
ncbi:piggyBac transposable element-derived protein 4-like [Dysidea avara]|uniref:piggyBac transposable element-derived protein 4-like n=1 Tax=Dysidea avara TaxID=196820 RepID=UPI0033288B0D